MPIFQPSVLKNFPQDESKIAPRWAKYQEFLSKIDYIKTQKEEKYQDGFLRDIFENTLGYTLDMTNPQSFNLEREKKNETDGKKADGVIILNSEVVGVIELKDQKTKNLDQIEAQAFNYHNSHTNSKYIIISNFDELRFYIDKKTAYEKFNLFSLTYDEFKKLHLLLSFESIKEDIPLKLKEKSTTFEAEISKQLYKDFSTFRTHLFENIVKNNDQTEKSTLLRLTQKLCDRIIFILFAEDRELLKHNTIKEIREHFANQAFTNYTLYDIYKFYFDAINNGNDKLQIPKYNGGLFAKDELLDSLKIDDISLDMEAQKLSDYDFASDISVNILGHIFEQSLTDLEEIQSNIDDIAFDKTKSKRKKDGVFYTPEYITKYIVQNTLGKLCEDKKTELNLQNVQNPANPKKLTKEEKQTLQNIYAYREYLLNLKILDPACGSGAFLNQALEFLIKEHNDLDMLRRAYENELLSLYDIETNILEHNLYGVDINEDAVEIARLSLWLRTAQRGKSLTNLSEKIVCANSLLNMPFSENSFDVVIGNPPYGAKLENDEQKYYEIESKESAILFMLLSHKLLKENGLHSFIIPKPFIFSSTWESIRDKFKNELFCIVDCGKVWEEVKLEQVIYSLRKDNIFEDYDNLVLQKGEFINIANIQKNLYDEFGFFINGVKQNEIIIALKIKKDKLSLLNISVESNRGGMFQKEVKNNEKLKVLAGANIQRYEIKGLKGFLSTDVKLTDNSYLRDNSVLFQEIIAHIMNPIDHIKLTGTVVNDNFAQYVILDTIQQITLNANFSNKFILGLLNSKLLNWYIYRFIFAKAVRTMHLSNQIINRIPVVKIDKEKQQPFINLVNEILESKQKIKDYKILFDEAKNTNNFDREIALKKELEKLENLCATNEKIIDEMVYKLYDLSDDEIKIVEGV